MATLKYPNIEAERARHQLTKTDVARELGVSERTYYNYLRGTPIPGPALVILAKLFGTTTDYLLGLTEYRTAGRSA